MAEAQVTEKIIGAIIEVHGVLGPGFLESIYRRALMQELRSLSLFVEEEKEISIHYKKQQVGLLDLLVEKSIVVELKTVEELYLKAAALRTGILVNFAGYKADFRRIDLSA